MSQRSFIRAAGIGTGAGTVVSVAEQDGDMLQELSILTLRKGQVVENAQPLERVFLLRDAPLSNLVVGEVVAPQGRWSSYPPHHHPLPEIYHYRFAAEKGFGFAMVGDQTFTVRTVDTILIRAGQVYPQAAAPGYAMWYLWSIRHLDESRYRTPVFQEEHAWTARPKGGTK